VQRDWAISRTAGRRPRKEILTLRVAWHPSLWRLQSYVSLELKVRLRVRENKTAITARLYSPTMLFSERRLLQIPLSTFRPRDLTFSHGNRTKGSSQPRSSGYALAKAQCLCTPVNPRWVYSKDIKSLVETDSYYFRWHCGAFSSRHQGQMCRRPITLLDAGLIPHVGTYDRKFTEDRQPLVI
jgi:hypothetical protein